MAANVNEDCGKKTTARRLRQEDYGKRTAAGRLRQEDCGKKTVTQAVTSGLE